MKSEKRYKPRSSIQLSINIELTLADGSGWGEDAPLKDISALGVGLILTRTVKRGQLLFLTIPMPKELRLYDLRAQKYHVWGIVTRCIKLSKPTADRDYSVGVAFIGKTPPPHYHLYPGRLYELSDTAPEEHGFWKISNDDLIDDMRDVPRSEKRPTRLDIAEAVTIEVVDENNRVVKSETTVTENISLRGAAVFSQLNAEVGSFVRVTSKLHRITLISMVRAKRVGPDGINRLHVEFVDNLFPLDGIA
jgi:PilZ domain